jgi:hypothetical protein
MTRSRISGERIVVLLILGVLLFSPPFILIFDKPVLVAGIPLLFLYLFAAWAALIVLMMLVVERGGVEGEQATDIKAYTGESGGVTNGSGKII